VRRTKNNEAEIHQKWLKTNKFWLKMKNVLKSFNDESSYSIKNLSPKTAKKKYA